MAANRKPLTILLALAWLGCFAWGLSGLYVRLDSGFMEAGFGSYIPWGIWTSGYVYLIGLSAGAFLLSSLVYVFGLRDFARIGRLALFVAAVTLVVALFAVWIHLARIERVYELFTRPNFSSLMAWLAWLYATYLLLIVAELWLDMRCDLVRLAEGGGPRAWLYRLMCFGWRPRDLEEAQRRSRRALRVLGGIGVPLAIAFHGGVGALFATLSARPYWHTGLFPILFLTGALLSGGALLLAIVAASNTTPEAERSRILRRLSQIVLGLILADLLLHWAELSIPTWYRVGPEYELIKQLWFGPFWYMFWIVQLLLGSLVPLALLWWRPTSRWAAGIAGGLVAVTFMAVRLNLVIPGEITPALRGIQEAYVDPRLTFTYVASSFEWSLLVLAFSVGIGLFVLGRRYLPLVPEPDQAIG